LAASQQKLAQALLTSVALSAVVGLAHLAGREAFVERCQSNHELESFRF
jgi:hypothetical protein